MRIYYMIIIINSLNRLRSELEILLFKISAVYKQRKQRILFLLNNYNLIITILKVKYLLII